MLATLRKNVQTDLHEIFREGWQRDNEQMITFWWRSRSGIYIQIRIATLVRHTLVEVCNVPVLLVINVLTGLKTEWQRDCCGPQPAWPSSFCCLISADSSLQSKHRIFGKLSLLTSATFGTGYVFCCVCLSDSTITGKVTGDKFLGGFSINLGNITEELTKFWKDRMVRFRVCRQSSR